MSTPLRARPGYVVANVPCTVCGSDESHERYTMDFRRWGQAEPFVLRRCAGCGLSFNSPRLDDEGLAALYGAGYYFFDRPSAAEFRRIVQAYARTVAHVPRRGGRLLEVGSAKGYMLAVLARLGWDVTGVELSATAAEASRRRFGLRVFDGDLDAFRRTRPAPFDVVLAQDVLEHVPEPIAFLRGLAAVTAPDGWIVVDTPNGGAANIAPLGPRWRGFNPFHIFLFDRDSLVRAAERAGLRVEAVGSYHNVPPEASAHRAPAPRAGGPVARARRLVAGALDRARRGRALSAAAREAAGVAPLPLDPACPGDNLLLIARPVAAAKG